APPNKYNDPDHLAGSAYAWWQTNASTPQFCNTMPQSWNGGVPMQPIGPASIFQTTPIYTQTYDPVNAPNGCDFYRASSPHSGGINLGMGDGGVRFAAATLNANTWWAICTPAGGEPSPNF